jgi:hypothetical protein
MAPTPVKQIYPLDALVYLLSMRSPLWCIVDIWQAIFGLLGCTME